MNVTYRDAAAELCPLPVVEHPQAEQIEEGVRSWAGAQTIFHDAKSARAAEYGRLSAGLYPRSGVAEAVLAGCVLMYLFELDGELVEVPAGKGDAPAAARQLLRWEAVLAPHDVGTVPPRDDSSRTLLGLWQQITAVSGREHQARLRLAWRTYALGAAAEAAFMSTSTMPSPAEYAVLRAHTIADWPLVWIEITSGYVLPEALWNSPAISRLNQLSQHLLGISNDIWSWSREHAASDTAVNYPAVLARHHQCSLARGLEMTLGLHRKVMEQFLATHERLSRADCSLTRRYANDVATLVAGWYHWCERTSRYAQT
ncbi:hypothetical protein FM076_14520 [Streptomyces albus subsp. chlorinus]|uniref:terpene synthase family protein n=1 Tax=Streptomyces albus TaxID=1888 RepID=UPI00156F5388|nr:hypothetical protein [Streptomyces albus]NSC22337.1 hypothetical protein [Streptomyces albus subsp. chlorinus]